MKTMIRILSLLVVSLAPLISSCGDDNGGTNPVYDLRTRSRLSEESASSATNRAVPVSRKGLSGHVFIQNKQDIAPGIRNALSNQTVSIQETYTYEYGGNAHLYWTKATGADALGNIIATATQTLDSAGFPTQGMWYDGEGVFKFAYDYTYDATLYLRTSIICYLDDPTDNPDARRDYERSSVWNEHGILTTGTEVQYDSNGIKISEYKWRSTTLKNSLRGAGGLGYDEYYKEYEEGLLTYQEKVTFDSDGYPQTYSVDSNGDGTYEETYYSEITKTVEGYLESLIWIEDSTGDKKWKATFAYDEAGLLKTTKDYDWVGDGFVLITIVTDVWYRNPVNGPTGGMEVYFESDEEGNPLGDFETIDWTETQKTHHYYASPGEEALRITDSLEKIRLP